LTRHACRRDRESRDDERASAPHAHGWSRSCRHATRGASLAGAAGKVRS
jgi:hypothetical protein